MHHPADMQMLLEHQQLCERAQRLYNSIVDKDVLMHMPTQSIILIQELYNIVITGNPSGITNANSNDPHELPFTTQERV